jgi:shikimate kinase
VDRDDRPIFLVGFMGSGKTTVGKRVAGSLGRDFIDTDDLVVEREGRAVERIFRESGEAAFRRAEWEALQTLDGRGGCVVATGGGLFQDAARRRWLRGRGIAVWLDAPLSECLRRVGTGSGRPLWRADGDPEAFRALFERRRATYALAAVRVPAAGPADAVAGELLVRLARVFP